MKISFLFFTFVAASFLVLVLKVVVNAALIFIKVKSQFQLPSPQFTSPLKETTFSIKQLLYF